MRQKARLMLEKDKKKDILDLNFEVQISVTCHLSSDEKNDILDLTFKEQLAYIPQNCTHC